MICFSIANVIGIVNIVYLGHNPDTIKEKQTKPK